MAMAKTKDFRVGHRERVRARFLREGLLPFQDYEVIELLLFYAVPRRDTKPLAHALVDGFGSLDRILRATKEELCAFPGVGERTASLLRSVMEFMCYVAKEEPHEAIYSDEKALAEYFYERFDKSKASGAALVLMNNRNEIIRHLLLETDTCVSLLETGRLATLAFSYRASQIAFADFKSDGIPFPGGLLLQNLRRLREELQSVGIHLHNYLMLAGKQYNSVLRMLDGAIMDAPLPFWVDASDTTAHIVSDKTAEVLSSLLKRILPQEKAEELATALLVKYGTLAALLSVPYDTLVEENPESASALLFLRIVAESYTNANVSRVRAQKGIYNKASKVGQMFCDVIGTNAEETVALAFFDRELRLIDIAFCAHGSVNTASVVMRSMMEIAVSHRAVYVAAAHNHPSGTTAPSTADAVLTSSLYDALHRVNILFLDHFIVTEREFYPISRHALTAYTDAEPSFFKE